MHSSLGKKTRRVGLWLALIAIFGIGTSTNAWADQQGSQAITQAMSSAASAASSALGAASIANGAQNQQQGSQTQNMAQMAMGAMQIAQGLLGLLAAAQAGKNANQAGSNAGDMSGLNGYNSTGFASTSPTPNSTNSGSSTTNGSNLGTPSTTSAGITAADLRSGTLGQAMNGIEQNFGIPRDQFAAALQAGTSPQDILANAPKNAPSADLLNKIADGLASNGGAGASDAAGRVLASLKNGDNSLNGAGAGTGSAPAGDGSVDLAKAGGPAKASSSAESDALDESFPGNVSPEVKAAIAAKAALLQAEREREEAKSWNIFQLVHSRYQKLETMLYGRVDRTNTSPTATIKGF